MGMGCGISLIKYILFVFNLVCALCGIAILAVGITIHLKISDLKESFEDTNIGLTAALFIALGAVIFVIAFFGCCGAINESSCMTATYSTFLLLLLIAQIVFGVLVFMNMDEFKKASQDIANKMWTDRANQMKFWDTIQPALECCGLNTQADWVPQTPKSCCAGNPIECTFINAYPQGCAKALSNTVDKYGHQIGIIALAVAGIELLGVIFACCLSNSIRNQNRRYA